MTVVSRMTAAWASADALPSSASRAFCSKRIVTTASASARAAAMIRSVPSRMIVTRSPFCSCCKRSSSSNERPMRLRRSSSKACSFSIWERRSALMDSSRFFSSAKARALNCASFLSSFSSAPMRAFEAAKNRFRSSSCRLRKSSAAFSFAAASLSSSSAASLSSSNPFSWKASMASNCAARSSSDTPFFVARRCLSSAMACASPSAKMRRSSAPRPLM